jgi:DNA-binding HxlR family transcriptional regulator
VLGLLQDVLLGERVCHLVLLDDDLLLEDLDGVQVVGGLLAAQDHLAERALAQHLDELEVLQRLEREKKRLDLNQHTYLMLSLTLMTL